jgi:hypothetical protein
LNGLSVGARRRIVFIAAAAVKRPNLSGATLTKAKLLGTVFGDVDLTDAIGLETCDHQGPSIIDLRTLKKFGPLPLPFLRGVGLPDNLID